MRRALFKRTATIAAAVVTLCGCLAQACAEDEPAATGLPPEAQQAERAYQAEVAAAYQAYLAAAASSAQRHVAELKHIQENLVRHLSLTQAVAVKTLSQAMIAGDLRAQAEGQDPAHGSGHDESGPAKSAGENGIETRILGDWMREDGTVFHIRPSNDGIVDGHPLHWKRKNEDTVFLTFDVPTWTTEIHLAEDGQSGMATDQDGIKQSMKRVNPAK